MAGNQIRKIEVKAVGSGIKELKDIAKSLGLVNQNVAKLSGSMSLMNRIGGFAIAGLSARELMEMSDSVQVLKDRLTILTGSSENASAVFEKLKGVATATKTSIADIGTIYARLAASTEGTGASTEDLLNVTQMLQNTFRLSGATTTEATAATIQLSQGLASGQLRGQEMRSVLEQNVYFGQMLANTFGIARGQILKLAEAGFFTADRVFKVLALNTEEVNRKARGLSQTFGQSLTLAMDKLRQIAYDVNEALGLSKGLAWAVDALDRNLGDLIFTMGMFGAAWAVLKIPAMISGVNSLVGAFAALKTIIVGTLIPFVMANPVIAAIAVALAGLGVAVAATDLKWKDFVPNISGAKKPLSELEAEFQKLDSTLTIHEKNFGATGNRYITLKRQIDEARESLEKYNEVMAVVEKNMKNVTATPYSWEPILNPLYANKNTNITADASATLKLKEQAALAKQAKDELDKMNKAKEKVVHLGPFAELNAQLGKSIKSVQDYAAALSNVVSKESMESFNKGSTTLFDYNEKVREATRLDLTRLFNQGAISAKDYAAAIESIDLMKLNDELAEGKLSLKDYDYELSKVSEKLGLGGSIQTGAKQYISELGTLSSRTVDLTTSAFNALEDSLIKSFKEGKANFQDFLDTVLDGINRILIQQYLLGPIAGYIGNFSLKSGGSVGGGVTGGGYSNPLGDYTYQPTVMGKATMMSTDFASVSEPVTVNVINNVGAEVKTQEKVGASGEKILDVMIVSKMREGISSGMFDSQFNSTYGLKRRGV